MTEIWQSSSFSTDVLIGFSPTPPTTLSPKGSDFPNRRLQQSLAATAIKYGPRAPSNKAVGAVSANGKNTEGLKKVFIIEDLSKKQAKLFYFHSGK